MKKRNSAVLLIGFLLVSGCSRVFEPKRNSMNPTNTSAPTEAQGGQTGDGGFLISATSRVILERAQKLAINKLKFLKQDELDSLLLGAGPVNMERLETIIRNLRKNKITGSSVEAINAHGQSEPRHFSYGTENGEGYIEAQPFFFQAFAGRSASPDTLAWVAKDIIHEALHLFGLKERQAARASELIQRRVGLDEYCLAITERELCMRGLWSDALIIKTINDLENGKSVDLYDVSTKAHLAYIEKNGNTVDVTLYENNRRILGYSKANLEQVDNMNLRISGQDSSGNLAQIDLGVTVEFPYTYKAFRTIPGVPTIPGSFDYVAVFR